MKAIGTWDFDVYDINDELQRSFTVKNLIVNLGLELIAKAMTEEEPMFSARSGSNQAWLRRLDWKMVFGTSNIAVEANQINLGAPVLTKEDGDEYSSLVKSGEQFIYSTRVDVDDANGNTLREAGLYDRNGIFFSRVLISPEIVKTTSNWFNATATIQFT